MVVEFKRGVYEMALNELARYLPRQESRNRYLRGNARPRQSHGEMPLGMLQLPAMPVHMELPAGASFDPDPQHPR